MIVKTIKSFNLVTRNALLEKVQGYVNKSKSLEAEILRIKKRNDLKKIYRFDLGENIDGFSPKVNHFLENLYKKEEKKVRIVGNIPYNLTSPIIFKMIGFLLRFSDRKRPINQ